LHEGLSVIICFSSCLENV